MLLTVDPVTQNTIGSHGEIEKIRTGIIAHVRGQYEMRVSAGRPTTVSATFREPDEALVFKMTWDRAGSA